MEKIIHIQYFAALREQAGIPKESLETNAENAEQLYAELHKKYQFSLPISQVKVAFNGEYQSLETSLHTGDQIVFIPPVAGG